MFGSVQVLLMKINHEMTLSIPKTLFFGLVVVVRAMSCQGQEQERARAEIGILQFLVHFTLPY